MRVKQAVDEFVGDRSGEVGLVFAEFRRIQEAFRIMKVLVVAVSLLLDP